MNYLKNIGIVLFITVAVAFFVLPGTVLAAESEIFCNGSNVCTVDSGTSPTISWTGKTGATSCNIYNVSSSGALGTTGWGGVTGSVNPVITTSKTYRIICNNEQYGNNVLILVNVKPPVTADIRANGSNGPITIPYGGTVNITWNSENAGYCRVYPNGWTGLSGSRQDTLTSQEIYTLDCYASLGGNGENVTDTVTVNVNAQQISAPTVSLTADNSSLNFNESTTLRWNSNNATSCSASGGTNGWSGSKNLSGSFNTGSLTSTRTYTITCSNSSGSDTDSVTVNVGSEPIVTPPTVDISADDTSINNGQSTMIRWFSDDATSCTASGGTNGWSGSKNLSGSFNTGSLTVNRTYTISCSNSGGSDTDSVTVVVSAVEPEPEVTVNLTADQATVSYGTPTTLRWNSSNATSCSASGGSWSGNKNLSGSQSTGNLFSTKTYTITCSRGSLSGGLTQVSDSVTVNVGSEPIVTPPTVDISADDTSINSGQSTMIRWTSDDATSCTASGGTNGWSGSKNLSGSFNTGSLTVNRTYTISCSNSGGSDTDSVTVVVSQVEQPEEEQPTVDLRADDTDIESGDRTTLRWSSDNADYCTSSGGRNGWSTSNRNESGSFNTGDLTITTTYHITCYNSEGSDNDSVTIRVDDEEEEEEDEPTVDLRANDTTVDSNDSTILRWTSTNADTCRASGGTNGWSGSKSRSGSFNTGGLNNAISYYITCSNEEGDADDSVTVRVNENRVCLDTNARNYRGSLPCTYNTVVPPPTVTIYADRTSLSWNGATTVRWSTTNATSCYASGGSVGWAGAKSIGPGSFYTGSLTGSKIYTITCSNDAGSSTDSVSIGVLPQVINTTPRRPTPPTSIVLITSSVDRNQPIVPSIDNTRPRPGDEINYTVSYQNIGNGAITNLTLRLDLPREVDYLFSNPSNPTMAGNVLIFKLGTLKANGEGTVTVRVRVQDDIPPGTDLDFPAILTYTDPAGDTQSVAANVSAEVWREPDTNNNDDDDNQNNLGANAIFSDGFFPTTLFGWLLLLVLILILAIVAKNAFGQLGGQRQTAQTH